MPNKHVPAPQESSVHADATPAYARADQHEDWPAESGRLPPRPRRRLLTPAALALLGVLAIACGFIGGVLVEKAQSSTSSPTSGSSTLASRFAALRGGASGAGSRAVGGGAGGFPGASAATARARIGTVAYLARSTLYVTNSEGNTVKVTTSPATAVTKTVNANVRGIHPGETVTVTGTGGPGAALQAESISVGASSGGDPALFGG